jgi:hypothetical protein
MSVYLVRATFPNISGMAADEFVNSFVFNSPSSLTAAETAIFNFYNAVPTGATTALKSILGPSISRTVPGTIQGYDITAHLDGAPHGGPISTGALPLPDPIGTQSGYPDQLAFVVSYHAVYGTALERGPSGAIPTEDFAVDEGAPATHTGTTRPKSSLRGRLYIGPLMDRGYTNVFGRVNTGGFQSVSGAAHDLMSAALGWCVWSRRTASVHDIVGGWVDNELGVQRRRATKGGGKTPWVGAP